MRVGRVTYGRAARAVVRGAAIPKRRSGEVQTRTDPSYSDVLSAGPGNVVELVPRGQGIGRKKVVVVCFDGDEPSWGAFWWACGEAKRLNGCVVAVHVVQPVDFHITAGAAVGIDVTGYVTISEHESARQCRELERDLCRAGAEQGTTVQFVHVEGNTAEELLGVAREVQADVVAIDGSTIHRRRNKSLVRCLTHAANPPVVVIVP